MPWKPCTCNFRNSLCRLTFRVKQLLWSRFVNLRGGAGRNISCDLHMEHLNRALKTAMSGLRANVTKGSIARSSKCLKIVTDVATNFDDAAGVPFVSEKHSEASYKHDLNSGRTQQEIGSFSLQTKKASCILPQIELFNFQTEQKEAQIIVQTSCKGVGV